MPGRVLAAARVDDGRWSAGTRDALYVIGDESIEQRVPWEQVQRADWDQDTSTLRVEPMAELGSPVHRWMLVIDEPGALLDVVRERVTASVLWQVRVELGRRRGFTVIARRAPAGDGPVVWAYEFDAGVDPDDPEVREAAETALADAKVSSGLT